MVDKIVYRKISGWSRV